MPVCRGAINPTATPTQGHFVLSLVSLASRDLDDGPVELNDRHLRSHGKIGDYEQSISTCFESCNIDETTRSRLETWGGEGGLYTK